MRHFNSVVRILLIFIAGFGLFGYSLLVLIWWLFGCIWVVYLVVGLATVGLGSGCWLFVWCLLFAFAGRWVVCIVNSVVHSSRCLGVFGCVDFFNV